MILTNWRGYTTTIKKRTPFYCKIEMFNSSDNHFINCIINENPDFINEYEEDFHLKNSSPAIDAGKTTSITKDTWIGKHFLFGQKKTIFD